MNKECSQCIECPHMAIPIQNAITDAFRHIEQNNGRTSRRFECANPNEHCSATVRASIPSNPEHATTAKEYNGSTVFVRLTFDDFCIEAER